MVRSPHDQADQRQDRRKKHALWAAILLSFFAFAFQLLGSYYTGSLALLGDTAHVFTDLFSLAISLLAVTLAARAPDHHRSFGLFRLEVLAAFLNGLLLAVVSLGLIGESVQRLLHPSPILALPLVAVAAGGFLVNGLAAWALSRSLGGGHEHGHSHGHSHSHDANHSHSASDSYGQGENDRNIQGALLHVLSDAVGSLLVVIGGGVTYFTHWLWVDPLLAIVLSVVILRWSWKLLSDSGHVLLEGTPPHLKASTITGLLHELDPRVKKVEDLHVWEITSRMYLATAEVQVEDMSLREAGELREQMDGLLREKFGIAHSVLALKV